MEYHGNSKWKTGTYWNLLLHSGSEKRQKNNVRLCGCNPLSNEKKTIFNPGVVCMCAGDGPAKAALYTVHTQ